MAKIGPSSLFCEHGDLSFLLYFLKQCLAGNIYTGQQWLSQLSWVHERFVLNKNVHVPQVVILVYIFLSFDSDSANRSNFVPSHTCRVTPIKVHIFNTPEKFENAPITGHFRFLFEELSNLVPRDLFLERGAWERG